MCFDIRLLKQGARSSLEFASVLPSPRHLAIEWWRKVSLQPELGDHGEVDTAKQRRRFKGVTHARRHRKVVQRFEGLRIHRI